MKFDLGEVLSSAIKITWNHKVLWLFSALPMALNFAVFPLMFIPFVFMGEGGFDEQFTALGGVFFVVFMILFVFISLLGYALYGIGSSALVLGVQRVEGGAERLTFGELFSDSKPYWMRVLGVLLLIGLGVGIVFTTIFGCMALFGMVTAGIGFICIQPFILLMYPLMIVLYGVIEESQVAVVLDDLGVSDAIRRGWELVRNNFWGVAIASLIVYMGISVLSGIVIFPLMLPMFLIPFLMDTQGTEFDPRTLMLILGCFSLLFVPVMALVQGVGITFLKTTYTLIYVRVLKSQGDNTPVGIEADAQE